MRCFGMPFYAGWGLTQDRLRCARRTRVRSLDELVAATLMLYPVYVDPHSGDQINVETAVELLVRRREQGYKRSLKGRLYNMIRRPCGAKATLGWKWGWAPVRRAQ